MRNIEPIDESQVPDSFKQQSSLVQEHEIPEDPNDILHVQRVGNPAFQKFSVNMTRSQFNKNYPTEKDRQGVEIIGVTKPTTAKEKWEKIKEGFTPNLSEQVAGIKQGGRELGQALGQAGMWGGKFLDVTSPESYEKYTGDINKQREAWLQSPEGKSQVARSLVSRMKALPWTLPLAFIAPELTGVNIAKSAAAGGLAGATEFVPSGSDKERLINTLIGAGTGAAVPIGLKAARALPAVIKKVAGNPFQRLGPLEEKLEAAKNEIAQNTQGLEEAKATSQQMGYGTNPNVMTGQINQAKQELQEGPIKPEYLPKIENSEEAADFLNQAKIEHKTAINNEESAKTDLEQDLNRNAAHGRRVSNDVLNKVEEIKAPATKNYQEVENDLITKKVKQDNYKEIIDSAKEVKRLQDRSKLLTGTQYEPVEELKNAQKALDSIINEPNEFYANNYLTAYRSAKKSLRDTEAYAYQHGIDAKDRENAFQLAGELSDQVKKMKKTLYSQIGDKNVKKLQDADKIWAQQIAPLYKNPYYTKMKFTGKVPANMIEAFSGTETGQDVLNKIIAEDPEIIKNIIGQRYAKNVSKLHDAYELTQEYINKVPKLQEKIDTHRLSMRNTKYKEDKRHAAEVIKTMREKEERVNDLVKENNKVNISLAKKIQIQKDLKKAKADRDNYKKLFKEAAKIGLGSSAVVYKASRMHKHNAEE